MYEPPPPPPPPPGETIPPLPLELPPPPLPDAVLPTVQASDDGVTVIVAELPEETENPRREPSTAHSSSVTRDAAPLWVIFFPVADLTVMWELTGKTTVKLPESSERLSTTAEEPKIESKTLFAVSVTDVSMETSSYAANADTGNNSRPTATISVFIVLCLPFRMAFSGQTRS